MRAGCPNLRFHFVVASAEFDNLLFNGLCQRFGLFFVKSVCERRGLRVQLPLRRAFAFEDLWIDALTNVGAGFDEFRWPRPVRPGDELHIEAEVLEVRPSKSRPDQGMVKLRTTTFNQNNEPVQISVGNLVVPRRPQQR